VIVAAGPGVNELWPSEDSKDLTFKRGQNLEFYDDTGMIARIFMKCFSCVYLETFVSATYSRHC
jgi:hypothetical protein